MSNEIYFDGAYGDQPLLVSQIRTEEGRDIAVQSPARGNNHYLQDRGQRLRRAEVTILFVTQPGRGSYLQRFDAFRTLVNSGEPQIFVHPLIGSYRARVDGLNHDADADLKQVVVTCAFLAEDEPTPVFPVGAGVAPIAGVEAVSVASSAADTALAGVGLASPIPANALAIVTGWSDQVSDALDTQEVLLAVSSLTSQIDDAITAYELTTNLDRWEVYRSFMLLAYQLKRAAEAFTSAHDTLLSITITTPRPLLAIAADLYGPDDAVDMAAKVARINRIRTPARIPAGTVLRVPAEAS